MIKTDIISNNKGKRKYEKRKKEVAQNEKKQKQNGGDSEKQRTFSVSYTHLTLPTKA